MPGWHKEVVKNHFSEWTQDWISNKWMMRIARENTTCLVIDIQEKLFPVMNGKEDLLKNCRMLIQGMQLLHIPLIVTQQYTKGLGETIPEISSEIARFSYIEKRDFSCCGEPDVLHMLKQIEVRHVVLCGIETHVCILQTALDLKESGWIPVVVADAVTSRHSRDYELALERFRFEEIMMVSAESLLFELTGSSSAPEFKSISALVK